jgi:NADPH-dependent curcumin reductase CurA
LLSIDPTIRTWMDDVQGYLPPIALGEVVRSVGIGEVVAGNASGLPSGSRVFGLLGWQDYAALDGASLTPVPDGADPQKVLNLLGITGLTAYFGLRHRPVAPARSSSSRPARDCVHCLGRRR